MRRKMTKQTDQQTVDHVKQVNAYIEQQQNRKQKKLYQLESVTSFREK